MAKVLLALWLCLAAQSTTAEYTCKDGKSTVEDIDEQQIAKSWKAVYINNKDILAEYSCWVSDIGYSTDRGLEVLVSIVRNSDKQNITSLGTYKKWDGHFLNMTLPGNDDWTFPYDILATDYKNFKIAGGCPGASDGQAVVGIGFLTWTPDEKALNAAKEALPKVGLGFEDFELFCPLSAVQ